mmetsp:Transcript_50498/g.98778  ORF Transcript_50498/g.98778 Transcript_50498/m.98778 type:complete len:145 (+) Transcript_50498:227-661(+)
MRAPLLGKRADCDVPTRLSPRILCTIVLIFFLLRPAHLDLFGSFREDTCIPTIILLEIHTRCLVDLRRDRKIEDGRRSTTVFPGWNTVVSGHGVLKNTVAPNGATPCGSAIEVTSVFANATSYSVTNWLCASNLTIASGEEAKA